MRPIDADALERVIKTECNPYGKPTIDFESGKKVLKIIERAPTIELLMARGSSGVVIPVTRQPGEWKEMSDNYGHSSYFCSRCGTQEGKAKRTCPNCGADMQGGEEENSGEEDKND